MLLAPTKTISKAYALRAEFPRCPVCADTMIAAEAAVLADEGRVTSLWTCDTCGYGFVTHCEVKPLAA